MTPVVRQAVAADLPLIAPLFDQYRRFQGQAPDLRACEDFLRARLDHGEAVLFLATLGGDPAGFAQLYPIHSSVSLKRVFVLNDLYVAEAGRRRGVATALLQALEAHAWAMGASSLRLNVARANTDAQALYEAASWARDEHFFMYQRFPAERAAVRSPGPTLCSLPP
jgi:ribosomal protein S18 acetylase RimI-like enzyme